MASAPFTIRIFVPDGDPEGVRIINRMNWTCYTRFLMPTTTSGRSSPWNDTTLNRPTSWACRVTQRAGSCSRILLDL
jgi:hypothetical protein